MPFLFEHQLSTSVAVNEEFFTKINLICGKPHMTTEQIILHGFDMSICAAYMDLTSHSFFIHSSHYSYNMQTMLLDTQANIIFLSYMKNLLEYSHMTVISINNMLNDHHCSALLPSGQMVESSFGNLEAMVACVPDQYFLSVFDLKNSRWSHLYSELNEHSVKDPILKMTTESLRDLVMLVWTAKYRDVLFEIAMHHTFSKV